VGRRGGFARGRGVEGVVVVSVLMRRADGGFWGGGCGGAPEGGEVEGKGGADVWEGDDVGV
jgi:hypothetical protein